jgi:hypothetical protein
MLLYWRHDEGPKTNLMAQTRNLASTERTVQIAKVCTCSGF